MTQFDEAKHNRASDGKFANKPHAEADSVNLATQGSVAPPTIPANLEAVGFNLERATGTYLGVALESNRERLEEKAEEKGVEPFFLVYDFDARSEAKAASDLAEFLTANAEDVETAVTEHGASERDVAYAFWLSRSGYGPGFFDTDYGDVTHRLEDAAQGFAFDGDIALGEDGTLSLG